jgi:hypothetical protein
MALEMSTRFTSKMAGRTGEVPKAMPSPERMVPATGLPSHSRRAMLNPPRSSFAKAPLDVVKPIAPEMSRALRLLPVPKNGSAPSCGLPSFQFA